jgi:hypothetical protein
MDHCPRAFVGGRSDGCPRSIHLEPIRVLILGLPVMLREVVRETIASEPDVVVVGELPPDAPLADSAASTSAAVVVLAAGHPETGTRPPLVAVADGGGESFLLELRPKRTGLGELSPQELVRAIRNAAARAAEQTLER